MKDDHDHGGEIVASMLLAIFISAVIAFYLVVGPLPAATGITPGWHDKVNDRLATLEAIAVTPTATCVVVERGTCLVPRETPDVQGR